MSSLIAGRPLRAGLAAALLLTVVACGGSASPAVSPSVAASPSALPSIELPPSATPVVSKPPASAVTPSGYRRTDVSVDGFSVAVPESWEGLSLAGEDLDAMVAEMEKSNPELAKILKAFASSGQPISFVARSKDAAAVAEGFAPNVNIIKSRSQGLSAENLALLSEGQLQNLDSLKGKVERTPAPIPAGNAVRLRYTLASSPELVYVVTQYIIVDGDSAFAISLSAKENQLPRYEDTFKKIAESFALKG